MSAFITIDMPDRSIYVTAEMLSKHNLSKEEAYKLALDNLMNRTPPKFRKLKDADVVVGDWNDGYDSSRILLPKLFTTFDFIKKPKVAIPARGRIVFWDASNKQAEISAKKLIDDSFENEPGPLSKEMFEP